MQSETYIYTFLESETPIQGAEPLNYNYQEGPKHQMKEEILLLRNNAQLNLQQAVSIARTSNNNVIAVASTDFTYTKLTTTTRPTTTTKRLTTTTTPLPINNIAISNFNE